MICGQRFSSDVAARGGAARRGGAAARWRRLLFWSHLDLIGRVNWLQSPFHTRLLVEDLHRDEYPGAVCRYASGGIRELWRRLRLRW